MDVQISNERVVTIEFTSDEARQLLVKAGLWELLSDLAPFQSLHSRLTIRASEELSPSHGK